MEEPSTASEVRKTSDEESLLESEHNEIQVIECEMPIEGEADLDGRKGKCSVEDVFLRIDEKEPWLGRGNNGCLGTTFGAIASKGFKETPMIKEQQEKAHTKRRDAGKCSIIRMQDSWADIFPTRGE